LLKELSIRKDYLESKELNSVYFGGGTPSLLSEADLDKLWEGILIYFSLSDNCEVTLEANPDDLDEKKVKYLANSPVNRLSIGIQSFFDEDLKWMNRAHSAKEAKKSIELCQQAGFDQITIDLIYGVPTCNDIQWEKNIDYFLSQNLPHLSAYALTVEPGTALNNWINKQKVPPLDEERALHQFSILQDRLSSARFEQYEISNFAKDQQYAIHNSNYWSGKPYLGIGPSAHSYNGNTRQWNVSNNAKYLRSIADGSPSYDQEKLSKLDNYNEAVMLGLRTQWGVSLETIQNIGSEFAEYFEKTAAPQIGEKLERKGDLFSVKTDQRFFSDGIAASLFWVED
ncbi:MAG: radical SAM family heme chaperone HemW, partial [Saprospiraceae bacterium]|nr:radical SAM family heme chaperone HemW [Saprospiraceae bacterium]